MPQEADQTRVAALCRRLVARIKDAFSLKNNLDKLTAPREARNLSSLTKGKHLCSLDVLRVLSTIWIVVIHSYSFALSWMSFEESASKRNLYKSLPGQFLANGTFSVDNFFLMSGFLTFLRHCKYSAEVVRAREDNLGHRCKRFLALSLKRYGRLVPLLMLMILFSTSALPHLRGTDDQSKWLLVTQMFDHWCRLNWPVNLLLAHNFVQTQQMCFSHSWYVAVDFQLFLLLELFVLVFGIDYPSIKPTAILCAIAISLGQLISTLLTYMHDLPAIPLVPVRSQQSMLDFYRLIYIKPFHWASSYFIGVLLARIVMVDGAPKKGKLSHKSRLFCCCISGVMILFVIFSNIFHFRQETPMSRGYASMYALFARPVWSTCVACLIALSLQSSKFNLTNSKTKRRILSTLSRLSYSVYLLHPVQMATFYGNRTEMFQFSHYLLIYFVLGNIFLTYLGATLVYILIELPIQNLLQIKFSTASLSAQQLERRPVASACESGQRANNGSNVYELRSIGASERERKR